MNQTSTQVKTASRVVTGIAEASALILKIARDSQWFEFTPLPDDEYEIRVKAENQNKLMDD